MYEMNTIHKNALLLTYNITFCKLQYVLVYVRFHLYFSLYFELRFFFSIRFAIFLTDE